MSSPDRCGPPGRDRPLTREHRFTEWRNDQNEAFLIVSAILRHEAKYGERVVYAGAPPVVMRRNLPAGTQGTHGGYLHNYVVV